ncbi:natriuretic peptides B [Denticeps clupeoides]|uniref:natriuretic peptides B n=1 Tax=Denticeps clupeoides TaxID=299321 RepID=UPI0010A3BCD3|nr:natriuretic peptides B [Denticeps clupeoides]
MDPRKPPVHSFLAKRRGKMLLLNIPLACLLSFFILRPSGAHPLQSQDLTPEDMDVLKLLLQRLEESASPADRADAGRPEDPDLAVLSARDLKTARGNSAPKRSGSGCFGRRIDRIGSTTSLGCNTVSRSS